MANCKECGKRSLPKSHLCFECREDAMVECKPAPGWWDEQRKVIEDWLKNDKDDQETSETA